MYALEDEWKGLTPQPLSGAHEAAGEGLFYIDKGIDPDTILSEKAKDGLQYIINQERYLNLPKVPIDNSANKPSIRPFCVGISNWHVVDSIKGGTGQRHCLQHR